MPEQTPTVQAEPKSGFFVWTKSGKAPRFHHTNIATAQAEAERLSVRHPGQRFIVMAGVSKHWVEAARSSTGAMA